MVVDYRPLSDTPRRKALTSRITRKAGRNNQGRITVRHQGGGEKRLYRAIDFSGGPVGISGRVESIEYDPYRSAFIACVVYRNGERRYMLSAEGLRPGAEVMSGATAPLTLGCRTSLGRIPVGSFVHNIEIRLNGGGQLARSAGTSVQILAHEEGLTLLKLSSGETRKIPSTCAATIGQVSNRDHNLTVSGKAGRSRWLGIRPTVRGKVMNPRDHPYGGGEGRTQRGTRRPKTKWGKITGGRKTRDPKKWSNTLIVKRRQKK